MKLPLSVTLFLLLIQPCFSQKNSLDYSTEFPKIGAAEISNNGKYVYHIFKTPLGENVLVITETYSKKKKEIPISGPIVDVQFTADSRRLLFTNQGDSLTILELENDKIRIITNCISFKVPEKNNQQVITYLLTDSNLVVENLETGNKTRYPSVKDYKIASDGTTLLLIVENMPDGGGTTTMKWINIGQRTEKTIWHGRQVENFVFDISGDNVAFIAKNDYRTPTNTELWYFNRGKDVAQLAIGKNSPLSQTKWVISSELLKFSPQGDQIFFSVMPQQDTLIKVGNSSSVDVWSYKDAYLQSEQLNELKQKPNQTYISVFNIDKGTAILLQDEMDTDSWVKFNEGANNNYLLFLSKYNSWETSRLPDGHPILYLINTYTGERKEIVKKAHNSLFNFSPAGRFVFWYDTNLKAFLSYDLSSGITHNITEKIPDSVALRPNDFACWSEGDKHIYVYDDYDIWKLDPSGQNPAINVTNGWGKKHNTVLRYVYQSWAGNLSEPPIDNKSSVFLCGFNKVTKHNGFFEKKLSQVSDPAPLIMSNELFYFSHDFPHIPMPKFLFKAKDANVYLLKRMSATDYPNLVITNDFKSFENITNLEPQREYIWLTSELVSWKTYDDKKGTGILYKPENFDSKKKYPIIFYFYETLSDGIHKYLEPGPSMGPLNISNFVSQGYLVFCPDIEYKIGEVGQSVYNYVVSAAKFMSHYPWVDSTRMGIQGHSFGGYEVNYLVTHTNLFAAASSAAGVCDYVSMSGNLKLGAHDFHDYVANAQSRLRSTLWTDRPAYIRNSPIFFADKVSTPLLIVHSKNDTNVPWSQSVEFFTALRYLGKKVWMLQYDNGSHSLYNEYDKIDYSLRLKQFFDYYLKGGKPPKWMTTGIPASKKGIDSGYELDATNNIP